MAQWTNTLIPDIRVWEKCGYTQLGYFITKRLTGYSCLMNLLNQIQKRDNDVCMYCLEKYDAKHLSECIKWNAGCREVEATRRGA